MVGMLIVDEVHKLKNIKDGVRAEALKKLSSKLESNNGYLCLLSGTPVPNSVSDVAMLLRLLYPEKFKDIDDKQLVASIVNGKILELRDLLLSRMERKEIQGTLEMPDIVEEVYWVELTNDEKDIYELIQDNDELTSIEKMVTLRKFLLKTENKVKGLERRLNKNIVNKENTVVFVNGFVDEVLRGDGNLLGKIKVEGCEIEIIDGNTSNQKRKEIQERLRTQNNLIVFVSGQTADVGVDFSGSTNIEMYNLPWTDDDARQQIGRVYRYGQTENVKVVKSVVKGSLEEGIMDYVEMKRKIIDKLIRGIPLSELEKEILLVGENESAMEIEGDEGLAKIFCILQLVD
jgi:SNF2 family DNA or RNA helicase